MRLVPRLKHVPRNNGILTEVFRRDWNLDDRLVDQVFQSVLGPGAVSAWHAHQHTTDRLPSGQRPRQRGGRFSRNAAMPSWASSERATIVRRSRSWASACAYGSSSAR
jgi:hypothetical protein